MQKKMSYRHPDLGKEMTQAEMLTEHFQGQPRFRLMGVAPAGVTVTEEMRQRVESFPAGTLVDMKHVTRHIFPIDEVIEKEKQNKKLDVKAYRRFTFVTRQRVADASRMVAHSDSPLFPDR